MLTFAYHNTLNTHLAMATHLAVPGTATAGSIELISDIEVVGKLDVNNVRAVRQHFSEQNRANNFTGTNVLDATAPVTYQIAFTHAAGMPTTYWTFATSAARDTAYGTLLTALTT